jgi:hypothetical protein
VRNALPKTIQQIRLSLHEAAVPYQLLGQDHLTVGFGSAEILIEVVERGESTIIRVSACVLDDVVVDDADVELLVLRALNNRNRTLAYGKFFFDLDRGRVNVEYELLGDFMQDQEFINALTSVAQLADDHDDLLQREIGMGRRAADRLTRAGDAE